MKIKVAAMSIIGLLIAQLLTKSISADSVFPTLEQCRAQGNKYTLCHATSSETNPYVKIEIACEALYGNNENAGHLSENGTPLSGHEEDMPVDENGLCPGEAQPTPTPAPSPSPSVSPDPGSSPDPGYSPNPSSSPDPSSSPNPEQSPDPGSSPNPNSGKHSSLGYELSCNNYFDATMDLTEDGQPKADIEVKFTYGSTLTAKTNSSGRARVSFGNNGNGTLKAEADGYPSQSLFVTFRTDCPTPASSPNPSSNSESSSGVGGGQVLGASTAQSTKNTTPRGVGQVLGATTLANTGTSTEQLAIFTLMIGLILSIMCFYGYRKTQA